MKKRLSILLILAMIVSALAGCSGGGGGSSEGSGKPMVVGYSNFSGKFSPIFAESAYDQDVASMTAVSLLNLDRVGMVVEKGKTGETREYNGTDYTYYGIADLTITPNDDGSVDYDFDLRDDIKFSDGEKLTADDVIFSLYVLLDPTYDGSTTLYSLPIKGMEAYRTGMTPMLELLCEKGKDNTDFSLWDEETQTKFWTEVDAAGPKFAQTIIDYCINNGYNAPEDSVSAIAVNWGYELPEDATVEDFWKAILEKYEGDYKLASETETAGVSIFALTESYDTWSKGIATGESAASVEGIQKTGDYSVRITLTQTDATAIYTLGVPVLPMHYYGDVSKYDYANNKFGFDKGDLSTVRAKTTQPMGAGPYKFVEYSDGVVYFEANENYFLGAPKTKNVQFKESSDTDKLNGVVTGTIDITDPTYSRETVQMLKDTNSNGEVTGDKITTNTVDNLGYGYLGINAYGMNVGGKPGSEQSKNLRKAFATIYSRYRDVTVNSYYGETASVINYPISNTSWAAPRSTDADYEIAFSKDVNGNDIYKEGMSDEEKDAAALQAALGFLEAAGFTVVDGKVTAAPEGASLTYEVWIPGDGEGNHPSFMMLDEASKAFEKIGMTLVIKDLANSSDLWDGIKAKTCPMWCAAWQVTPDPDMFQIYYADAANGPCGVVQGKNPFGGDNQGGSNYQYCITDPELDSMILDARTSMDQSYRKQVYKSCLDTIVDWAVEVPVYQRQNAIIFSTERVKMETVTPDITTYYGWMNEIQNIEMQ